ncbi:Ig-like domain-containing protein, partial [Clostridium sp.]|uniref:Ig-like domain-containing protein n=1 Tax=Clostridium sp. TaxID=1506 RepID=UPI002FC61DD0
MNKRCKYAFKSIALLFFFLFLSFHTKVYAAINYTTSASTAVSNISFSSGYLALKVGGSTGTLSATVLPAEASNKAVTWSSSDETIAKISSSGVVTPVSEGIAVIKVKTVDGGHEDHCIVMVTKYPPVKVTGLTLSQSQVTLKMESKLTLTPTINPSNATNKEVIWSSSDEGIATVNDKGIVTPLLPGVAVIRATTVDGNFSTFSVVYVVQGVNNVTLSSNSLKLKVGDGGVILTAKVNPDNVSLKEIKWTSSNPSVAIVGSNGVVIPVSKGSAVITATSLQDSTKSARCSVTVDTLPVKVTGITLDSTQQGLKVGGTLTLKHTVSPSNAANKAVVWSSSDETIAKVSNSG